MVPPRYTHKTIWVVQDGGSCTQDQEQGWPICTGPLDYVCLKTGRSKTTLLAKAPKRYREGGFERVVMDESELERKWPK